MTTTRTPVAEPARLLDVETVSKMLGVSSRHVYRLCDVGKMPPPMKLGGAVRWDRQTITDWIDSGCPHVATQRGEK
ncbi:helix-turn-helix domain-containing protein [Mariniblastus sp.]|nr:helix-turn-helix domain-containing protein [Mariniblastus sp.]